MKTTPKKPREQYDIQTSQETDAIARAAAHGKSGKNWRDNAQAGTCYFEMDALSHTVHLSLMASDGQDGATLDNLRDLIERQDSDFIFTLYYIMRLMSDAQRTATKPTANVTVVLDDVISAIGLDPRSTEQRHEMRRRVWDYIQFGKFATIRGQRAGRYRDPQTKEVIETFIECVPWAFVGRERPQQTAMWGEVPVSVQLAPSDEWMRVVMSPVTRQYLPMGEVLGAIPGGRPAGEWARVIGLSVASFWRRQPEAALNGSILQTRREILDRIPPKLAPYDKVLKSNNPTRAILYWCDALAILVQSRFIDGAGEPCVDYMAHRMKFPRQDWRDSWLDEKVDIRPSELMQKHVEAISKRLPTSEPKKRKNS